jgi:hypothetical protein
MLPDGKSRRFQERQASTLTVRVRWPEDGYSGMEEETHLTDFSRMGGRLTLRRRADPGQLLFLTFAMPRRMRAFDHAEPEYRVWAVVRAIKEFALSQDGKFFEAGVAFVGKSAPEGFMSDTSKRYDLKPVPTREGLWAVRERPRNSEL